MPDRSCRDGLMRDRYAGTVVRAAGRWRIGCILSRQAWLPARRVAIRPASCEKAELGRTVSAPTFGSAVPGRSVFRPLYRLAWPVLPTGCLQGGGFPRFNRQCRPDFGRLLPRRPLFPVTDALFRCAYRLSRREFCRFPPRNAPSSPFCTERGGARANSGRPKPPGAPSPVRGGALDRTGHRPFCTGRPAHANQTLTTPAASPHGSP